MALNERTRVDATVYTYSEDPQNPGTYDWFERAELECLNIQDNMGITPSSATFRYVPSDIDKTGPITLSDVDDNGQRILHAMPVAVSVGGEYVFSGTFSERVDQGAPDRVMWTAIDHRRAMQSIPVRGALVLDDDKHTSGPLFGQRKVKFIPNYYPWTNPKGDWNCTFGYIALDDSTIKLVPVFASAPKMTEFYDSPLEAFNDIDVTAQNPADEGKFTAWSPRYFLYYLWALVYLDTNYHDGTAIDPWRTIIESDVLTWDFDSIGALVGIEDGISTATTDPLDRKMPSENFQGRSLLLTMQQVMQIAGSHDFKMGYPNTAGDEQKAQIEFFVAGLNFVPGTGKQIRLNRAGPADDATKTAAQNTDTAYDFSLKEDSSQTVGAVYTEGKSIEVETSLTYDPDDLSTSTTSIVPAWTAAEEAAFIYIVNGGDTFPSTETYAHYPETLGDTTYVTPVSPYTNTWKIADGNSGRAAAITYSPQAVALARELFPTVFRAWRIKTGATDTSSALDGANDEYTDETVYPRLNMRRPVLPTQLQYMLRNLAESGSDPDNFISTRFPVRVQIYNSDKPYDVPFDVGIRVTNDAQGSLLWIDGLAEQQDGKLYCVYTGRLMSGRAIRTGSAVRVGMNKKIVFNLAMRMDHRVNSYQTGSTEFFPLYGQQVGGPYMQYVDSPTTYFEMHQVNSTPTATAKYYSGGTTESPTASESGPLTRLLPPGSEVTACQYASQRKLLKQQNIQRTSSWSLVGVRTDYEAGDWIDYINLDNDPNNVYTYTLRGNVKNVVWDFENQVTHVGGVLSEFF